MHAKAGAGAGPADEKELERLLDGIARVRTEVAKGVVGQSDVVDQMLIALICGGHVLLEGSPGVGKTLLVRTLSQATGLDFSRIQFTPDLMPADVTGGMVLAPDEAGRTTAVFQRGPVFTQILLADEINRATPKTQSSLLEAMQEGTVTAAGTSMALPRPFFVLATQNPIEMEGTYQLPEAQIDRFLFKSLVNFPSHEELDAILDLTTGAGGALPEQVLGAEDILSLQAVARDVPIASHVRQAIARFTLDTHPERSDSPDAIKRYIRFGLSPRGAQALVLAAKGHALLDHRYNVAFEDVRAVLLPTLRHRLKLNFRGESDGVDADALIEKTFETHLRAAA